MGAITQALRAACEASARYSLKSPDAKIEEQLDGLQGVERVTSTSRESSGSLSVEVSKGTDLDKALTDVKNAVDSIRTFPQEIERPLVSLAENERHVVTVDGATIAADADRKSVV